MIILMVQYKVVMKKIHTNTFLIFCMEKYLYEMCLDIDE